jgi:hypothetical protein
MEIKGTAVKTTPEFIKEKFPGKYDLWLESLPEKSRAILTKPIYAAAWYDLSDSVVIPTKKLAELCYSGNYVKAAHTVGRYSAEVALTGIYKMFVRVSSPHFVLSSATSIFSSYYKPSDIKVIEKEEKSCVLQLSQFNESDKLIMHRIAGWVEKTLEITLKSVLSVNVQNSVNGGGLTTRILIEWN